MKNVMMIAVFATAVFTATTMEASVPAASGVNTVAFREWKKSASGTWAGVHEGKTLWYKLDKKGGLWHSADGKEWMADKGGAWTDKDGKWLKIHDKKLVWSTDGTSWSEVPEWKWEGADGKWNKFDAKWNLWVNE